MACTEAFTAQFDAIQKEVRTFLSKRETTPYFNQSMVLHGKGYHTLSLAWWGIQFHKNQRELPVLSSILKDYPALLSLSINVLDANSRILPHMGDTNAIYRGHFGISIPSTLPQAGIRVMEADHSWEEGHFVWFMDAYPHETWNNTIRA